MGPAFERPACGCILVCVWCRLSSGSGHCWRGSLDANFEGHPHGRRPPFGCLCGREAEEDVSVMQHPHEGSPLSTMYALHWPRPRSKAAGTGPALLKPVLLISLPRPSALGIRGHPRRRHPKICAGLKGAPSTATPPTHTHTGSPSRQRFYRHPRMRPLHRRHTSTGAGAAPRRWLVQYLGVVAVPPAERSDRGISVTSTTRGANRGKSNTEALGGGRNGARECYFLTMMNEGKMKMRLPGVASAPYRPRWPRCRGVDPRPCWPGEGYKARFVCPLRPAAAARLWSKAPRPLLPEA